MKVDEGGKERDHIKRVGWKYKNGSAKNVTHHPLQRYDYKIAKIAKLIIRILCNAHVFDLSQYAFSN